MKLGDCLLLLVCVLLSLTLAGGRHTEALERRQGPREGPDGGDAGDSVEIGELMPLLKWDKSNATFSDSGLVLSIAQTGLSYMKNILVEKVIRDITPLLIPNISIRTTSYYLPLDVNITNIVLYEFEVPEAAIQLSNGIITVFVDNVRANISSSWSVLYGGLVGDAGESTVEVSGMQVGLSFMIFAENGTLWMNIIQHGVVIENLSVWLDSYASWIYNWVMWVFQSYVKSEVESAVSSGVVTASLKLNDYLQSVPRIIPVDSTSAVDASIYQDPVVDSYYLSFSPRGQFLHVDKPEKDNNTLPSMPVSFACSNQTDYMLSIAISEYVANSASSVYFEAGALQYLLDHLPDSSPFKLTTASWKYILPRLYLKYPSANITLLFQASQQPLVSFDQGKIGAFVVSYIFINVYSSTISSTPVACLSMNLSIEAIAAINNQNITGEVLLDDLSLSLLWSNIGVIHVKTVQAIISIALKTVVIPSLNSALSIGFPLPSLPLFTFTNSSIFYEDSYLIICSNVEYDGNIDVVLANKRIHPSNEKKDWENDEKLMQATVKDLDWMTHSHETDEDGAESARSSSQSVNINQLDKENPSDEKTAPSNQKPIVEDVKNEEHFSTLGEGNEIFIETKMRKHLLMFDESKTGSEHEDVADDGDGDEKIEDGKKNYEEKDEDEDDKQNDSNENEDEIYMGNMHHHVDKENIKKIGNEEEENENHENGGEEDEEESMKGGTHKDDDQNNTNLDNDENAIDEETGNGKSGDENEGASSLKNLNEIEKELDSILMMNKKKNSATNNKVNRKSFDNPEESSDGDSSDENTNSDADREIDEEDGSSNGNNDADVNQDRIKIQKEFEDFHRQSEAGLRGQVKEYGEDMVKENEENGESIASKVVNNQRNIKRGNSIRYVVDEKHEELAKPAHPHDDEEDPIEFVSNENESTHHEEGDGTENDVDINFDQ